MTTITSRPEQPDVVAETRAMIVRELRHWLRAPELHEIKHMPKHSLVALHHGLGMNIRNEYELWSDDHPINVLWQADRLANPLAKGEVDESPYHPDNFSFTCIEALWESLQ